MTQRAHLGEEVVARLVADQFPQWAQLPVAAVDPGGNDNRTFRLGEDLVVRLPSAAGYAAQVGKEHRWLPVIAQGVPLPIPQPVAQGKPNEDYPWPWSIYRWIDGAAASHGEEVNLADCAVTLGNFLRALHQVNPDGGPPPGEHNLYRGGPLATYDAETRESITALGPVIPGSAAVDVWEVALAAPWTGPPVWIHRDMAAGNLLLHEGHLAAVIDFGCCAVGDPACDLTIAWTLFDHPSRTLFSDQLLLDQGTWARARGWALWKALLTLAQSIGSGSNEESVAHRAISEVLADHQRSVPSAQSHRTF